MLALCTATAWASPSEWSVHPPNTLRNQLEYNQWAQEEFGLADAELNRVWNALTSKLRKAEKDALVTAQLKWIEFRDAQAKATSLAYQGGSIAPYIYSESQIVTTRIRTWQLKQRLDELVRLGH